MITSIFLFIALLVGYATTVLLSMAATFAITSMSHRFVVKDSMIRTGYKLLQEALWLPFTVAGAFLTSLVAAGLNQWMAGAAFIVVLVGVLWFNAWEMRQRGIPHQIAMSLITIAGVVIGFLLRIQSATP